MKLISIFFILSGIGIYFLGGIPDLMAFMICPILFYGFNGVIYFVICIEQKNNKPISEVDKCNRNFYW